MEVSPNTSVVAPEMQSIGYNRGFKAVSSLSTIFQRSLSYFALLFQSKINRNQMAARLIDTYKGEKILENFESQNLAPPDSSFKQYRTQLLTIAWKMDQNIGSTIAPENAEKLIEGIEWLKNDNTSRDVENLSRLYNIRISEEEAKDFRKRNEGDFDQLKITFDAYRQAIRNVQNNVSKAWHLIDAESELYKAEKAFTDQFLKTINKNKDFIKKFLPDRTK